MRNGVTPWFDEIAPWIDNGRKCIVILYSFSAPNEFFDEDWIELGYETVEEFEENVWQRLEIRYYFDDGTWETYQWWDDPNQTISVPFEIDDEEREEFAESIAILKEQGDLDPDKYDWNDL